MFLFCVLNTYNIYIKKYCPVNLTYSTTLRCKFSVSWWSGNNKYFCFLFIVSRASKACRIQLTFMKEFNYVLFLFVLYSWLSLIRISRERDLSLNYREIRIIENLSNLNLNGGNIKVWTRESVDNEFLSNSCLSFH